jgi:surface protein
MFESSSFNQNISNWNVGKVTNIDRMFFTTPFNQNIGSWNVGSITSMVDVFQNSPFNNGGSSTINNWNVSNVTNMNFLFYYSSFNQPIGSWTVSSVTNMGYMFANSPFNQNISSWNTSNVRDMSYMFLQAGPFNQDISGWTVSNVTNFTGFMTGKTASYTYYYLDNIYNKWSLQSVQHNLTIDFGSIQYSASGVAGKTILQSSPDLWTITDGGILNFTSVWATTASNESIILPYTASGTYVGIINWGDGTTSSNSYSSSSHTYSLPGTYSVVITGTVSGFSFNNAGHKSKIKAISTWGDLVLQGPAFYGCNNLSLSSTIDLPTIIGTVSNLFANCSSFTSSNRINEWNTSNVTDMSYMFSNANSFNQAIGNWNTSNVTNMSGMFQGNYHTFNQNIGSWNVSKVTNMSYMFYFCSNYNQPLNGWTVSSVTTMSNMFYYNFNFNQPIGNWDVSNVTDMTSMFWGSPFSNGGSASISNWNVSNVTSMYAMFFNGGFNQPIGSWNTSKVTNMSLMLYNTPFNYDISGWTISSVTNFSQFMADAGFGAIPKKAYSYLDNVYNSWSLQTVHHGLSIDFGTSQYTIAGSASRSVLTNTDGWTIIDGGYH